MSPGDSCLKYPAIFAGLTLGNDSVLLIGAAEIAESVISAKAEIQHYALRRGNKESCRRGRGSRPGSPPSLG